MPRQSTRTKSAHSKSKSYIVVAETVESDSDDAADASPATVPESALHLPTVASKCPAGKLGRIVEMAAVAAGTTLDELAAATGWQAHTIRAALCRLRQRGFAIALTTGGDGRKAYRLGGKEG